MKKMKLLLVMITICLTMMTGYAEEGMIADTRCLTVVEQGKTTFVLVYDSSNKVLKESVLAFADAVNASYGLIIKVRNIAREETPYEHEIVVGNVRGSAAAVVEKISAQQDFVIGANDGHLICYATDDTSYKYLFEYLANDFFGAIADGMLTVDEEQPFIWSQSTYADTSYLQYYQAVHHTYSSNAAQFMATRMNKADVEDQQLVDALTARLAGGFAVFPGSSSALHQGYIVKMDREDYSRATRLQDGHVLIAAHFAAQFFGDRITLDADGYFDLTAYCDAASGYHLYQDVDTGVCVVMPVPEAFSASDAAYLLRMKGFFENKYLPEPRINTEQTRTIIRQDTAHDVANCLDWKTASYDSYYDPAILAVSENGQTVLYAAYARMYFFGGTRYNAGTDLMVSRDLGETWALIKSFPKLTAAITMEQMDGDIYLIAGFSNVQIAMYSPATGEAKSAILQLDVGRSGPGTPLIHNGRIYKPYGDRVISAALDSDLFDSDSWMLSAPVSEVITRDFLVASGLPGRGWQATDGTYVDWEEGNVVPGQDGKLYVIYRQNVTRGCALIFTLSEDGKTLSYVEEVNGAALAKKSIIEIPSAKSRHAIRYDEAIGLYLCLMNIYTGDAKTQYAWTDMQQRSVLALTASKDLVSWEVKEVLLVDRKMMNPVLSVFAHGYQYADFSVLGEELYFIVRENSGEETFNYHHEANFITGYTIKNYQSLVAK